MSFCWVRASATMRAALSWADFTVWADHMPRATNPTAMPTTAATTAATATSEFHLRFLPSGGGMPPEALAYQVRATPHRRSLGLGTGQALTKLHPLSAGAAARPEAALGSASGYPISLLRSSQTGGGRSAGLRPSRPPTGQGGRGSDPAAPPGRRRPYRALLVRAVVDEPAGHVGGGGRVEPVAREQRVGPLTAHADVGDAREGSGVPGQQPIGRRAIDVDPAPRRRRRSPGRSMPPCRRSSSTPRTIASSTPFSRSSRRSACSPRGRARSRDSTQVRAKASSSR